ncbi:LuxR C-terminal-related transcriptional regulator [Kitasatospora sp. NPDC059795]|uniref:LuxR C-terminal-related transcriptional regulator n=1 Tax=Kitasatospora sp. NPDC059795 TaxID=3346949 RepID=UPI00365C5DE1
MTEPGAVPPTDREKALYLAVLAAGRVSMREVMEQDAAAAARLLELGLLTYYQLDSWVAAVDPRTAAVRLGATLREHATGLLARADRVTTGLGELAESYDGAQRRTEARPGIVHLNSPEQIRHRLLMIEADYREEGLAAQPGPRLPEHLVDNARTHAALDRGAVVEVLYQPVARYATHTVAYAADATDWGVRVRVLDEPFARMMIFDRQVAVIAASTRSLAAAFVDDPVVIDHLVGVFQRDFARAVRVPWRDLAGRQLPETPHRIAELLATGLTQRAVASRLGLSERTVAAHIARLRDRYDAETLYQLGWLMRDGAR